MCIGGNASAAQLYQPATEWQVEQVCFRSCNQSEVSMLAGLDLLLQQQHFEQGVI